MHVAELEPPVGPVGHPPRSLRRELEGVGEEPDLEGRQFRWGKKSQLIDIENYISLQQRCQKWLLFSGISAETGTFSQKNPIFRPRVIDVHCRKLGKKMRQKFIDHEEYLQQIVADTAPAFVIMLAALNPSPFPKRYIVNIYNFLFQCSADKMHSEIICR